MAVDHDSTSCAPRLVDEIRFHSDVSTQLVHHICKRTSETTGIRFITSDISRRHREFRNFVITRDFPEII